MTARRRSVSGGPSFSMADDPTRWSKRTCHFLLQRAEFDDPTSMSAVARQVPESATRTAIAGP